MVVADDNISRDAFQEVIAAAGMPAPAHGQVTISGRDPVLPTRYRVGAASAAMLAATGLAAAQLWESRTGRRQQVAVDVRAAAASLRSVFYLHINAIAAREARDPLHGFYPTRDGRWIYLHCNFPAHRDAALRVLAAPNDRALVAEAARDWDGGALEDAIHAAGGCAGFVRSAAEWRDHPPAQAIRAEPLIDIARIGDAPPEPLQRGERPLEGLRVLDLTRVLAGPSSTRLLAEHGADVLRIAAPHLPDMGQFEFDTGLGKLAAQLDLRNREDIARLQALVREGDVLVQSFRPGALAALGLGPDGLARLRPGLIAVELSAWGYSGPWRGRRGFDSVVQAVSGMAQLSGDGTRPGSVPAAAIDYISGSLLALGAMVALARRAREGGSWRVRVSLARVGQWIVDRGLGEPTTADLTPEEIERLCIETTTPVGPIRHLGPIVQLSQTPGFWARPSVPPGHHAAEWPLRVG